MSEKLAEYHLHYRRASLQHEREQDRLAELVNTSSVIVEKLPVRPYRTWRRLLFKSRQAVIAFKAADPDTTSMSCAIPQPNTIKSRPV
ncbi:MAG TPA: hypothetical protein VHL11_23860 [Phototrophicaceae bacterium]|jgi:hypothetical protein|nr:hypothetical protein [Phototrophicaceae bacterium]